METYSGTQFDCGNAQKGQTSSFGQSGSGRKMESMKEFSEQLTAAAPFIATSLFGCVIQALKHEWPGWKNFTASALSAGFGAWLVYQFVGDALTPQWGIFASGMVGYSGGTLVDVALTIASKYIENFKPPAKGKGPNDTMED